MSRPTQPSSDGTSRGGTRTRDRQRTTRQILDAALIEFSNHGFGGARVDAIAERSGASKPMIYSYFGDKDALYEAALRDAYVQIREGERELDLETLSPVESICSLVRFTLLHYRQNPWFIRMLNTENLRGGQTVRLITDAAAIQSPLIERLGGVLARGRKSGEFRGGVAPVELYVSIASLCYFPISNAHTLRAVFGCSIDDAWLSKHEQDTIRMILGYLTPDPEQQENSQERAT